MDAEFDSKYPTCRNRPISHLKTFNLLVLVPLILYS